MKRSFVFASRCLKEIVRDPISYIFSMGMPIFLILLYKFINSATGMQGADGYDFYAMKNFTPGVCVFSFAFTMLNCALLTSSDRKSSLLLRLYNSPLKSSEFLLGYSLPLLPFSIIQALVCLFTGLMLGMSGVTVWNFLLTLVVLIPSIILYVALGLLFGSLFNDRAAPPMSSMVITLSTLAGGVWFDLRLFSEKVSFILHILPFANAADSAKAAMNGNYSEITVPLLITLAWAAALFVLASLVFKRKMLKD